MLSAVSSLLASLSLALKQPLAGYCDVETTHGDALVTKQGDYCTFIRIGGMKRMATRDDITRLANALRLDLSGALESKGHAIVGWYLSDPDMAAREIERINMDSCRRVGREVGLDLSDILDERLRLWSETMRWETSCFILWTRRAVLTKEELKQMKEEKAAAAKEVPRIGDAQRFFLRSELMAAHHTGFVNRVMAALARRRSRRDRTLGPGSPRAFAGGALPGDRGLAMEADPYRRQSHAAPSRGSRQDSRARKVSCGRRCAARSSGSTP